MSPKPKRTQGGCGCLLILILVGFGVWLVTRPSTAAVASNETLTPGEALTKAVADVALGDSAAWTDDTLKVVHVEYPLGDFETVDFTNRQLVEMACAIRAIPTYRNYSHLYRVKIRVSDAAGNTSIIDGLAVILSQATLASMNCNNQLNIRLPDLADTYDLHPVWQ
jgi:hypothetical protein